MLFQIRLAHRKSGAKIVTLHFLSQFPSLIPGQIPGELPAKIAAGWDTNNSAPGG